MKFPAISATDAVWATLMVQLVVLLSPPAPLADTIVLAPHRFEITDDTTFNVANQSSDSYLFSWSDGSGVFANVAGPTLVLRAGRTYTFRRVTAKHPLVITDSSLPLVGSDGAWVRTTADRAELDAAILQPVADFTADPAPTTDAIVWTPASAGDYAYTCDVPAHVVMTGRLIVTADGVATTARSWAAVKALYR